MVRPRRKIKAAEKNGFHDVILCEDLKEAVQVCADKANAGDAVLLSPACASWGQFDNYEQRGEMFKEFTVIYLEIAAYILKNIDMPGSYFCTGFAVFFTRTRGKSIGQVQT